MEYDQRDEQCDTCHELWNITMLDGGTCIDCLEIAEFGITAGDDYYDGWQLYAGWWYDIEMDVWFATLSFTEFEPDYTMADSINEQDDPLY